MPLTEEQQFKAGFLAACADAGLGPSETHQVIRALNAGLEKQALGPKDVTDFVGKGLGIGTDLLKTVSPWVIGANIAIPAGIGVAGGYGLAQLRNMDDEDPAELRQRESIDMHRRLAEEMAVQRRLREMRMGHNQATRPLVR